LVCNIFFRKLRFLRAGEAEFGPAQCVGSVLVIWVTVALVTAATNWSAMVTEAHFQSP
jgi:hypothetical protein